jgi:hypothetical protein
VVVPGDARARLERRPEHRIAHVGRHVEDRTDLGDLVGLEPLCVDAVELVRVHPPGRLADVLRGVRQVEHAALAEEEVVVQLAGQLFPLLERELVDRRARVPQVVGPDDGGVAGHVAAGQPSLLQHSDVGEAVVSGQKVGRGEAVAPGADNESVVRRPRVRVSPEPCGVRRRVRMSRHVGSSALVVSRAAGSSGDRTAARD